MKSYNPYYITDKKYAIDISRNLNQNNKHSN